jgi:hypothetical protein
MSGRQRAEKAKRLVAEIERQLGRALIVHAFWEAASKIMGGQSRAEALAGVAIIRALFFELVLIVTRLHDKDRAAASLPNLLACTIDPAVAKYLLNPQEVDIAAKISEGRRHQRVLERLVRQRDTSFAHFDTAKRGYHYGADDATILLEDTISMFAHLSMAVRGDGGTVAWEASRTLANRFWTLACEVKNE